MSNIVDQLTSPLRLLGVLIVIGLLSGGGDSAGRQHRPPHKAPGTSSPSRPASP